VFDWAVFGGDLTTLATTAELLPPSELHAANRFGCTAIHWAASGGSVAVLRWLYLLRPSLLKLTLKNEVSAVFTLMCDGAGTLAG